MQISFIFEGRTVVEEQLRADALNNISYSIL